MMLMLVFAVPSAAFAQIAITVNFGPPALPVYDQPALTDPNEVWQPGYWAYDPNDGYYWVPGTWVQAPQPGLYWTPGYWGWNNGAFAWNAGYWAPQVGYYGGINYGYGYYGNGYVGGNWQNNQFRYNTAVNNVNTTYVRNVYVNRTVIVNHYVSRVAYNGGRGGIVARPTAAQISAYQHEHRWAQTAVQQRHAQYAAQSRLAFAKVNHGTPVQAAVARPLAAPYKGPSRESVASESHPPALVAPLAHDQAAYVAPARPEEHAAPARPAVAKPAAVKPAAPRLSRAGGGRTSAGRAAAAPASRCARLSRAGRAVAAPGLEGRTGQARAARLPCAGTRRAACSGPSPACRAPGPACGARSPGAPRVPCARAARPARAAGIPPAGPARATCAGQARPAPREGRAGACRSRFGRATLTGHARRRTGEEINWLPDLGGTSEPPARVARATTDGERRGPRRSRGRGVARIPWGASGRTVHIA